jgi:hypothetical protein
MTKEQANYLLNDWGKNLSPEDYCETIYLNIVGIGSRRFKDCCYHDADGYIFIWTRTESFVVNKMDLGEFLLIPDDKKVLVSLEKVI